MSSQAKGTYTYSISECAMLVERVRLAPSLAMAQASTLQTRNAIYPCSYVLTYMTTIAQGSWSFQVQYIVTKVSSTDFTSLFSGQMQLLVICQLQSCLVL